MLTGIYEKTRNKKKLSPLGGEYLLRLRSTNALEKPSIS